MRENRTQSKLQEEEAKKPKNFGLKMVEELESEDKDKVRDARMH